MTGWVTINTDAGFYASDKVGSFAYWIKGDNLTLKASGMLKGEVISSTQAEAMAIANALHALKCRNYEGITKIIINRDNIYARSSKKGDVAGRAIYRYVRFFWDKVPERLKGHTIDNFCEYRHVKAHQKGQLDKRSWVNQWLDSQCTLHLRAWRAEHKTNNK